MQIACCLSTPIFPRPAIPCNTTSLFLSPPLSFASLFLLIQKNKGYIKFEFCTLEKRVTDGPSTDGHVHDDPTVAHLKGWVTCKGDVRDLLFFLFFLPFPLLLQPFFAMLVSREQFVELVIFFGVDLLEHCFTACAFPDDNGSLRWNIVEQLVDAFFCSLNRLFPNCSGFRRLL